MSKFTPPIAPQVFPEISYRDREEQLEKEQRDKLDKWYQFRRLPPNEKRLKKREEAIYACLKTLYKRSRDAFGNEGDYDEILANSVKDTDGRSFVPVYDFFLDIHDVNETIKYYLKNLPEWDRVYFEDYVRHLAPTSNKWLWNKKRLYDSESIKKDKNKVE